MEFGQFGFQSIELGISSLNFPMQIFPVRYKVKKQVNAVFSFFLIARFTYHKLFIVGEEHLQELTKTEYIE